MHEYSLDISKDSLDYANNNRSALLTFSITVSNITSMQESALDVHFLNIENEVVSERIYKEISAFICKFSFYLDEPKNCS